MGVVKQQLNKEHSDEWQKVSPFAITYYIAKLIKGIIDVGPQALAPLLAVFIAGGEQKWLYLSWLAVGVAVIGLAWSLLEYLRFKYRIIDNKIHVHSGVLKRKRVIVNFDRVQNITFKEPIYFRPFNLVVLEIECIGSSDIEAAMGGVPRALAEEIRTNILKVKSSQNVAEETEVDEAYSEGDMHQKGDEIIKQPIIELVKYGISSNRIWILASLIISFGGQDLFENLTFVSAINDYASTIIGTSTFLYAVYIALAVLSVIITLMLLSVLGAIIVNYNYHVTRFEEKFYRTRGLFERQETSLPERKIQTIKIRQPWLAIMFKRFQLHLNTISYGPAGPEGPTGSKHFYIPSVTLDFSKQFSKILFPNFHWENLKLKPISKMFIGKTILWVFVPISLVVATIMTIAGAGYVALVPFALPVAVLPFIVLRWLRYAYATDGENGIVRSGFLGHQLTIFPFYKVQNVKLSQSPGQKKAGLASLTIKLASSNVSIPFLPVEDAKFWRATILDKVKNSDKSWL